MTSYSSIFLFSVFIHNVDIYCKTTMVSVLFVLGSDADKLFKILIKTSNLVEYIESHIQNIKAPKYMILSSSMYEKTYL